VKVLPAPRDHGWTIFGSDDHVANFSVARDLFLSELGASISSALKQVSHEGTFGEHSKNIQGTLKEHSGNTQRTFREHSKSIQGTLKEHSGNVRCLQCF
jgi:hypothetical protein